MTHLWHIIISFYHISLQISDLFKIRELVLVSGGDRDDLRTRF